MQRARLLLAAAAFLALTAFTDPGKHFTIDFPSGWSAPVTDAQGNVQSDAPGADGKIFCRANSVALAALKNATQASLNAEYGAPLDRDTWAAVISIDAVKVTTSDGAARLVQGRIVQVATITLANDVMGAPTKVRFLSHILPGRMVNVGCFASTEDFDGAKAAFEKIVTSLKPL